MYIVSRPTLGCLDQYPTTNLISQGMLSVLAGHLCRQGKICTHHPEHSQSLSFAPVAVLRTRYIRCQERRGAPVSNRTQIMLQSRESLQTIIARKYTRETVPRPYVLNPALSTQELWVARHPSWWKPHLLKCPRVVGDMQGPHKYLVATYISIKKALGGARLDNLEEFSF
jgi:hypothetical protein